LSSQFHFGKAGQKRAYLLKALFERSTKNITLHETHWMRIAIAFDKHLELSQGFLALVLVGFHFVSTSLHFTERRMLT